MKLLTFSLAVILAFIEMAHAESIAPIPNMAGSYVGCSTTNDGDHNTIVFHLIEIPDDVDGQKVNYAAAMIWDISSVGNVYYQNIKFNDARTRMIMSSNLAPRTEFGSIVTSLIAEISSDGSIAGEYRTNSTLPTTRSLRGGVWAATKVEANQVPQAIKSKKCK